MTVQSNHLLKREGILSAWLVLLALSLGIAGCGGSSRDEGTAAAAHSAASTSCQLGKSLIPHVPNPPNSWTSGPHPAIALTCSNDQIDPGSAIAGFSLGGQSCVDAYSFRLEEAFGELCKPDGSGWRSQCERLGCVNFFSHQKDFTLLSGPVPARLDGVWIVAEGKQIVEGVMLATIRGGLNRKIGSKEPFGFFAAYIPRCVEPDQISVHLVRTDGAQLGQIDKWDVREPKCPASGSGPRS